VLCKCAPSPTGKLKENTDEKEPQKPAEVTTVQKRKCKESYKQEKRNSQHALLLPSLGSNRKVWLQRRLLDDFAIG
jgi:hypothetical protein